MKWRGRQGSKNVRSSRGSSRGGGGFGSSRGGSSGGGMGGFPIPIGGLLGGGGGIGIILLIVFFLFSGGGLGNLGISDGGQQTSQAGQNPDQHTDGSGDPQTLDEMEQFLSVSLKDSEDTWSMIFHELGRTYEPAILHTFEDSVVSGCGRAGSEVGPFYCSRDKTIYIDMTFYNDLKNRFGASGDFTMSYVLSHEVGHHVQNLLGILDEAHRDMSRVSEEEANQISVRLELQADYFAGVVARWQDDRGYLEDGDIGEAINAAEAIGDDTIQKRTQGRVMPDSFTHGTSEQRMRWYRKGFESGEINDGDTFSMPYNQLFAPDTMTFTWLARLPISVR